VSSSGRLNRYEACSTALCADIRSAHSLFWKVEPSQAGQFTFYGFITDYHEKHQPYASVKQIPARQATTAILDGQQRVTALHTAPLSMHANEDRTGNSSAALVAAGPRGRAWAG
jgi:hypothetical protein